MLESLESNEFLLSLRNTLLPDCRTFEVLYVSMWLRDRIFEFMMPWNAMKVGQTKIHSHILYNNLISVWDHCAET